MMLQNSRTNYKEEIERIISYTLKEVEIITSIFKLTFFPLCIKQRGRHYFFNGGDW